MGDPLVEDVARAIYGTHRHEDDPVWYSLSPAQQEFVRAQARAAVAATFARFRRNQPAGFRHAMQRDHNAAVTPFLDDNTRRMRKGSGVIPGKSIGKKEPNFRSKNSRPR